MNGVPKVSRDGASNILQFTKNMSFCFFVEGSNNPFLLRQIVRYFLLPDIVTSTGIQFPISFKNL